MHPRYTKTLAAFAVAGAIAVPTVAQARGGSDDPPNHQQREHQVRHHGHQQREHQVRHHGRHDRVGTDRRERRHDLDNDRLDGRGSDDGPSHS